MEGVVVDVKMGVWEVWTGAVVFAVGCWLAERSVDGD